MPSELKIRVSVVAFIASLAATFPLAGHATSAARVDFAVGDVKAQTPDGRSRPLAKGAEIANGETIDTGSGRAQVRFSDGAKVSLAPQTQFRIDDYHFAGKADGSEKGFFSLLKGALRTITGAVGRSNREKYRVTTTVATIGIRGTEFSVTYGNSINVTTGEGSNEVCNAAGCLILNSGESAHVADNNTRPIMTDKKADIPPPPVQQGQLPGLVAGNGVTSDGTPAGLSLVQSLDLVSGAGYSIAYGGIFTPCGSTPGPCWYQADGQTLSTYATFSGGGLTSFVSGSIEATQGTPVGMLSDGIVGWGRWIDASRTISGFPLDTLQHVHYVVGIPTPLADMSALQIASVTATFSLTGYTFPTAWNGSAFTFGTLPISADMTANFGSATVSGNLSVPIGGNTYTSSWSGSIAPPAAYAATQFVGSGVASGGSCTACNSVVSGWFFGPNASRAGVFYQIGTDPVIGDIQGAAVFSK